MGLVDASVFEKQQATPAEEIEAIAAANQLHIPGSALAGGAGDAAAEATTGAGSSPPVAATTRGGNAGNVAEA